MCFSKIAKSTGVIFACIALSGCVAVPPLQSLAGSEPDPNNTNPKSISINDVVVRVKCELRDSIASRTGSDYDWINKWTAQADLQLAVTDQSSLAPGAVFTQPLKTISNVSQSASLGIGASASTTAARTEIVSFSVSLKEIRDQFRNDTAAQLYEECHPHSAVGLTGDLGLKDWVDSALGPVQNHLLTPGHHSAPKAPGGGGASRAAGASTAKPQALSYVQYETLKELSKVLKDDDTLKPAITRIYDEYQLLIILSDLLQKAQAGASKPSIWDSNDFGLTLGLDNTLSVPNALPLSDPSSQQKFEKLKDITGIQKIFKALPATPSKPQLSALLMAVQNAFVRVEQAMTNDIPPAITALQLICDCTPPDPDPKKNGDPNLIKKYSDALKCLNTLLSIVKANSPSKPAPLDPPIDAISHQVQFIVTLSANANPTWSLVQFKGPSPTSGNFASLNGTNTDTLTITIGVPGSQATVNSRSALTFSTALANQLIPAQQANPSAAIIIP
jgi:hypothetical protein